MMEIVQNERGGVGFPNHECRWEMATSFLFDE